MPFDEPEDAAQPSGGIHLVQQLRCLLRLLIGYRRRQADFREDATVLQFVQRGHEHARANVETVDCEDSALEVKSIEAREAAPRRQHHLGRE